MASSIGTVLASFRVTQDPNSAWRKLPDWSGSADTAAAFATQVGNTQLNAADIAAKLAATQGLKRIRTLAAAKIKAAQDAAAQKLQTTIDALAAKNGTSSGPKFSNTPSTASASSTKVTGPRYSFTV